MKIKYQKLKNQCIILVNEDLPCRHVLFVSKHENREFFRPASGSKVNAPQLRVGSLRHFDSAKCKLTKDRLIMTQLAVCIYYKYINS